jgi:hypothetical protein
MTQTGTRAQTMHGIALLAFYLAAVLAPGFHALLHLEGDHTRGGPGEPATPGLTARGNGDKHDPEHPDHQGGSEQCVVCTQGPLPEQLLAEQQTASLPSRQLSEAFALPDQPPISSCKRRLARARAPPGSIVV